MYTIGFEFVDSTSGAYVITYPVYVTVGSLPQYTTTTGKLNVSLEYGNYTLAASSTGYYPVSGSIAVDSSRNISIPMTLVQPSPSGGSGTMYAPTTAQIQFFNQYYQPLSGMYVTLTPINTTTSGNWTILKDWYGISTATSYTIQSPSSGLTDASGLIVFPSILPVYYKITATNVSAGISYSNYIQVGNERRAIIINTGPAELPARVSVITSSTSMLYDNETTDYATLRISYYDKNNSTTNLTTYIQDSNGSVVTSHVYLRNATVSPLPTIIPGTTAGSMANNLVYTEYFLPKSGTSYRYGYYASSTIYGPTNDTKPFVARNYIRPFSMPPQYLPWLAIALMVVLGSIFSAYSVKFGAVVLPLMGFFFSAIGWLSLGVMGLAILGILITLGILSYIRKKENEL
jgi:hypothetical protein